MSFGKGDVDFASIIPGTEMWKTDDPKQERELEKSFSKVVPYHRIPINFKVKATADEKMELTASDRDGNTAIVYSDKSLDRAKTLPLTNDFLFGQLGKLGNTPYEIGSMEFLCDTNAPVMAPTSLLNELRRRIVAKLIEKRETDAKHRITGTDALKLILKDISSLRHPAKENGVPKLSVLVRSMEQANVVIECAKQNNPSLLEIIYTDFNEVTAYPKFVDTAHSAGIAAGLCTPRILKPNEENIIEHIAKCNPDYVLVRNLSSIGLLPQNGTENLSCRRFFVKRLKSDISINTCRSRT